MRNITLLRLVAASLAVLAASNAHAEDDCTVGREAIKPYVDMGSPLIEKAIVSRFVGADKRRFEQIFNVKGGITASVDVVGCSDFGVTFTFRPIRNLAPEAQPKDLIRMARELIETIPFNPDDQNEFSGIRDALKQPNLAKEADVLSEGISFSCGNIAFCEISVPKPRILQITYVVTL